MVAQVSQWDAVMMLLSSIAMPILNNAQVHVKGNGAMDRSPTVLGVLVMELSVQRNGAMLDRQIVRELAEECGAQTVEATVLALQLVHQHLHQWPHQQLQLLLTQALDSPRQLDTGIVPVAPVDAPIYRLDQEQRANLRIATLMPCLQHQMGTNMAQLSMEPPPSHKYSLATIHSGSDLVVERATS